MIAGFAAGLVVKLLRTAFKRLPSALVHIKTVLLYPVASLAVVGFMMVFLVNAPLGRFNTWIYQLLASMQGGSPVGHLWQAEQKGPSPSPALPAQRFHTRAV